MQRSVLLAELEEFENTLVIDIYRILSEEEHQYDLPFHFIGQVIRTDFDYQATSKLAPLGSDFGYQHLWKIASGQVEGSSLVSWLHDTSYYSLVSTAPKGSEVIFTRIGANDPDFNLRTEPAFILRQKGANHCFASVLETHGYFNESIEASDNARGKVKKIEIIGENDQGTVVEITSISGAQYRFGVSNIAELDKDQTHAVETSQGRFIWQGAMAAL